MRKLTLLLAAAALAAVPSVASAKTTKPMHKPMHRAKMHAAKPAKVAAAKDLNADTAHLFADMFAPSKPEPVKKKKK